MNIWIKIIESGNILSINDFIIAASSVNTTITVKNHIYNFTTISNNWSVMIIQR